MTARERARRRWIIVMWVAWFATLALGAAAALVGEGPVANALSVGAVWALLTTFFTGALLADGP